ncbi:MAG: efflux transporter outer membrane subunit, partial [Janthinobacterium lividum]
MRPTLRRALWALPSLFCAAACTTIGPDYHVPDAALVKQPLAARPLVEQDDGAAGKTLDEAASASAVPDYWWRLYDDPALDALVNEALASNNDLRVAAANLERANAVLGVAQAQGGFSTKASTSVNRAQESAEQYLLTEKLPVAYVGDAGLAVSYQLDLFGTLRRGVEASAADLDAVRAAVDTARITVVANVVRAYLESCSAAEEEDIANRSLALQNRSVELARRLSSAGRGAQPNVTRSVTQAQSVRADLPRFAAQRRVARYQLAALLARSPDALPASIAACRRTPRILTPLPVGDGAALLRRRPDVREAERRLAGATARIGVALGELYPNVSFGASAGVTGIGGDLGTVPTQRWGFGPLISWNFPANGTRGRIQAAHAGADIALAQFDGVVLNALRETQSRLATYAGDLGRLDALYDVQRSAGQSADETHRFFLAGRESFLADLDAARTLTNVNAQVAAAEGKVAQDQVDVFLALGGGWQVDHAGGARGAANTPPRSSAAATADQARPASAAEGEATGTAGAAAAVPA